MGNEKMPRKSLQTQMREQLFVREYLIDYNAARAYAAAYRCKNQHVASSGGYELLCRPDVQQIVALEVAKRRRKVDITAEDVLFQLKQIAMSDKEYTRDRLKALELLGKYLKLFVDRVETDTSITVQLTKELKTYSE